MPISEYLKSLRELVGTRRLLVPAVSAVVRNEEGDILFHLRADDGQWSLPAGAIDPGETPAEAIVREVREETGLIVEPERILGVFGGEAYRHIYPNGDEVEFTVAVFACRVTGGQLEPRDGEAVELKYFAPGSSPALSLPYPAEIFAWPGPSQTLFERRG